MIYYVCPDLAIQSAGIRMLYRHVQILRSGGLEAAILHQTPAFRVPDTPPDVPVADGRILNSLGPNDILVIPEGAAPEVLAFVKPLPVRRVIIALSWLYIYGLSCRPQADWRHFNIERVITNSPFIADYVQWAMRLPTHAFTAAVNSRLYYPTPDQKLPLIVYIKRKQAEIPQLMGLLWSRDPRYLEAIRWLALDGMSEVDYATHVRRACLFLNLSHAEGWPCSLLEAMRAGTLVAGWNSVGGKRELIPSGPHQNGLFVDNLDYPELARTLEPLLQDILRGDLSAWNTLHANAYACSQFYNENAETQSVLGLWHMILGK
jgi:glycosyltransferase involved in cell wall biosynthesis